MATFITRYRSVLFLICLVVISTTGVWLLKSATPFGLGLRNDSVQYIFGARNLLAGNGYMRTSGGGELKPITTVPPMFSTAIAGISLIGMEPLRSARFLILGLFGLDIILLGYLIKRVAGYWGFALAGAVLFAFSGVILDNFAWLMSEPLFVFFWLVDFIVFDLYLTSRKKWLLILLGIMAGFGYLTRYIGITLPTAFALLLLLFEKGWKLKFITLVCLILPFIPFMAGWAIRNQLLIGNPANRTLLVHIVTVKKLHFGIDNFWDWLLPDSLMNFYEKNMVFFHNVFFVILGLSILLLFYALIRFINSNHKTVSVSAGQSTLLALGTTLFVYLGMTLFSMSFIDASTVLDHRLMIPVYLPVLILLMAGFAWLYERKGILWKVVSILVMLACLGFAFNDGLTEMEKLSRDSLGFNSLGVKESPTIRYIKEMTPAIIYTNKAYMVYIMTGRLAYMLAGPTDPVTMTNRENYRNELESMRNAVQAGEAVLIYFKDEGYASDPWFLELTQGLRPIEEVSDGVIYKGAN